MSVEGQDEREKAEAERIFGTGEWDKPLRNAFLAGARFAAQRVERTAESQDERRAKIEAALETVKFSSNVLDYYEAVWTAALVESEARERQLEATLDREVELADRRTGDLCVIEARQAAALEALLEIATLSPGDSVLTAKRIARKAHECALAGVVEANP